MVRRLFAVVVCAFVAFAGSLHAGSTTPSPIDTPPTLHTPQGADAPTAHGDFVTSDGTTADGAVAMDTFYSYFVEVPPNMTSLQIQLYDADVGFGGAGEDTAGRDRDRGGYNTTATYSVINPAGAGVTERFNTGDDNEPAGSDNAWLTLYGVGNSVRDNFTAAAFNNNDGTADWAANWVETDAAGAGAGAGSVRITGGQLQMQTLNSAMVREVDLIGTPGLDLTTAFLTYSYSTSGTLDNNDTLQVQVSTNGGGAPWTTLATYTDDVAGTASHNITANRFNNTQIRFIVTNNFQVADELFFIDNVQISDGAAAPTAGHWEVRIAQTTGDSINAIGVRASDGDWTAGGTEYNVYADSFLSLGVNPDGAGGASRSYVLYPWVTAGCTSSQNDFDRDTDNGAVGSVQYTSRLGTFTQTITDAMLSTDDDWNRDDITNYTSNQVSADYGIWTVNSTITTYEDNTGNYETYYVGNYLVGNNPPAGALTQPYTGAGGFPAAYRIYMPTDAGTAPVKPYLRQLLTAVSGPQPSPAIGVARTYTVTVTIVNPTPHDITFSATNNVVANIPGSGTVYAGGTPTSSQGSVPAAPGAPAAGGTGNVTWNPGTLVAGGTATMAYNITVTPAVATTNATGTPGAGSGTRATYVDETGNTTQPRATYRLGGICELRVVVGALTEALLSSFEADRGRVAWKTASEAGTIGYNLYRADGSKVNDSLIPAGQEKYEIDDRSMSASYILEEITASGRVNRHGPLTTQHRLGPDVEKTIERPTRLRASAEASAGIAAGAAKAAAVMVGVRATGIVRVPFTELATRFGKSVANIANSAEKGSLSITNDGDDVAFTSNSDSLLFFGEKSDSIYSNDRIYRIDLSKGDLMANVAVAASNGSLSSFNGKVDVETDAFAAAVLPLDPESDYWFWDYVVSGDPTSGRKTFSFTAPDVASSSGASLEVRLQGALKDASHIANVKLNGVPVGQMTWSSLNSRTSTLNLPAAVLHDGANEVEIEGVLAPSAPFDVFYIDGFTISYSRYARPVNGSLEANIKNALSAGPFTSTPILLDITDRLQPKVLTGGSLNAGSLGVTLPSKTKTVFAAEQFVAPASYRSSPEAKKAQRGEYIVIAPTSMRSGAEALASLRQSDGLSTTVIDLEQIYDEFSNGNTTPHAIRAYIASALQQKAGRPRYVVLAGTGTLDYRGIQQAPGPVPPMMMKTNDGLFASDSKIADANGDGIPDLAIGRIPVSTNAELLDYVDKLRHHSASAVDNPIVFAADAIDGGGTNFGKASDEARQPVSGRPNQRLHIDDIGPQATRDGLIGAWTDGTPLINWVGHGGFDQIAAAGILTAGDGPSLVNAGRLPVLVAMTCTINRFEISGIAEPLGSSLTRQEDGGALAVWSASGLSNHENARELQRAFIQLAAAKPKLRLGDLIVQTLAAYPSDTAGIYVLLGDPAIALELPKEITNGGTPIHTGE